MKLQTIDLVLIAVYFAFVIALGVYYTRKKGGAEDYFLAGRKLGWFVVGFSLFASNISSTTLIGLMGSAYMTGVSISAYEWGASLVLVFSALFVIPFYLNSRVYTIPEFFERRFHRLARPYFAVVTILGNVFIETAGTLYAGAIVIQLFFPGIELWQSGILLAVVAGLYTIAGGLEAVVYTDVAQSLILLAGTAIMAWLAFSGAGGWNQVMLETPDDLLSMIKPLDDKTMPWIGLALGAPILSIYYWCTNQYVVQRILGAKSVAAARHGAIFAAALKLTILFLMVLPGIAVRITMPDIESPDLVFPNMVAQLLPDGIKGLVLAGFIAAIMSSIDSTLNSASTLVTMDFVRPRKPDASDEELGRIGKYVTFAFMLISAAWVPVVATFDNLFDYLQGSFAYLCPPIAAVFILGLFWKRLNGHGALAGMIGGHVLAGAFFMFNTFGQDAWNIHFLHVAVIIFGMSMVMGTAVALLGKAPDATQTNGLTWSPALLKQPMVRSPGTLRLPLWLTDYRWQAAAVVSGVIAMLIAFW